MQSALEAVQGVRHVHVSLKKKEARVRYDAKRTSVADLIEAVEAAGFEASRKR